MILSNIYTKLSQKFRPYKIEIYGLQDNYIGTLQSYNETFIGQIDEPEISINDDGSQNFTCSIPKFYIEKATNEKIINPHWSTINDILLVENTRILKVFIDFGQNEIKVFPFIIDEIIDKRDSHFEVYKEIKASGLAFSELGKIGYKIELNKTIFEKDYEKDDKIIANLNYWLDKVFPNEKDSEGKIVKWLTPWCYEIRMDWSNHTDKGRKSNKMYEDSYVSSWGIKKGTTDAYGNNLTPDTLVSQEIISSLEKARQLEISNSNKYNISQTIAETFEIFCSYEYKCNSQGKFIKNYVDESQNLWTGRKVIFYNRAINLDNPFYINYQDNLDSISRTQDSSEIYTKLYVTPIESSEMENGYVSIADTPTNPLLDDFILNFDYLYNIGSITDYQYTFINTYKTKIHEINSQLINLVPQIDNATIDLNNLLSEIAFEEKEISAANESYQLYRKMRNNEGIQETIEKNKNNSYSIVFLKDGDISQAQIRLQGVNISTIKGYKDSNYSEPPLFTSEDLHPTLTIENINPSQSQNFYIVLDEFGYPTSLYTSSNNTILDDTGSAIVYLSLSYSPENAYASICESLAKQIANHKNKKASLEHSKEKLEALKNTLENKQTSLLKEKEEWNQKLEIKLGPALREGYWTPDTYDDPGYIETKTAKFKSSVQEEDNTIFIFDKIPFEDEEKGFYYASVEDEQLEKKTYYPYIDLSGLLDDFGITKLISGENFLSLRKDGPVYTVPENSKFSSGTYHFTSAGIDYYFTIKEDLPEDTTIQLKYSKLGYNDSKLLLFINGESYVIFNNTNATNIKEIESVLLPESGSFEDFIYNNAGFIFTFITKDSESVIPIILITDTSFDFSTYDYIGWKTEIEEAYGKDSIFFPTFKNIKEDIVYSDNGYELRYPRIISNLPNVRYNSDSLKILVEDVNLNKYEDYTILLRNGQPHFTIKITKTNHIKNLINNSYQIKYLVSRANEMLYLDAKAVAYDNSQPRFSYELSIANIPNNIQYLQLGQLCYVNDMLVGLHSATGYISSIKYKLNEPWNDDISIKNYKTKFEDLFSTITASSEAIKNNQISYNIAAGSFNSDGTLTGSALQESINKNTIAINYSSTNVSIDDTNGILLTNNTPYANGVYGQVMLQGGGIFLSNGIDSSGSRIWNTGITPSGINASLITVGQLDTDLIRIFSGNNIAFQWNGEGIFAYKKSENNIDLNSYVKYSDKGLQFISNSRTAVDLGWNGLLISTQDGSTELTSKYGLTIYDGIKRYRNNEELAYNHVVRLGKFEDGAYGLKLYKNDGNDNYIENLITTNNGELWLKDSLLVGTLEEITWRDDDGNEISGHSAAGISGSLNGDNLGSSVRFWAGQDDSHKRIAPFQVWQDGTLIANKAIITGTINATDGEFTGTINATKGSIGNWIIEEGNLITEGIKLQAKTNNQKAAIIVGDTNSSNYVTITGDGSLTANGAVINGTINASGGIIGNFEIADINTAIGSINDITANMENITVEIISHEGNITKKGEVFNTTLEAIIKKGGITIDDSEYLNYTFQWQYSDDGATWNDIYDDTIIEKNTMQYEATLNSQRYIRCIVTTEVADSGN